MVTAAAQSVYDLAFANPLFAKAAIYTPPGGGDGIACRVLIGRADATMGGISGRPLVKGGTLDVRSSEVALPVRGGTFAIAGGETLKVIGDPEAADDERLVWTMTVA
ncbi:MAG: hypothetical protein AB7V13_23765 [Pseudorhodoplanes sp.]|uniref:head-tail joining protein n=1 Tax=Pseudorhodoplanes sp. TaxID=1934341 RepID=UPI003D14C136